MVLEGGREEDEEICTRERDRSVGPARSWRTTHTRSSCDVTLHSRYRYATRPAAVFVFPEVYRG